MDYSNWEMNSEHSRILHQIIGTPVDEELPAKLLKLYWGYKVCCDKASIRVTEQDLARFCADSVPQEKVDEEVSIVEMWRTGDVKAEDRVQVVWGQGTRNGVIKKVTASGDVMVLLDNEGDERRMKAEKVKVAELVEV